MILTESTLFGMFFLEDLIDLGMKLLCPKKLIHLGSVPKVIILMVQFSSISEMVIILLMVQKTQTTTWDGMHKTL